MDTLGKRAVKFVKLGDDHVPFEIPVKLDLSLHVLFSLARFPDSWAPILPVNLPLALLTRFHFFFLQCSVCFE